MERIARFCYVHHRGGEDTCRRVGQVTDIATCFARSLAVSFCKHFLWPKQKGFTYTAVGDRHVADLLARQWCRRGNYFCALWHAHDCADDFHFTEADKPEENLEFVEWMSSIQEDDFLWDHYAMPAWSCRPVS